MFNPVAFTNEQQVTGTCTLGFAPGNVTPTQLLILNPTGAMTVNLPPISSVAPQPPTTSQPTVGVGGGFRITLFNLTTQAITVTPNGNDTIVGTVSINTANSKVTLQACPTLGQWLVVA